jgi:iron complex outermembrane receptor protein
LSGLAETVEVVGAVVKDKIENSEIRESTARDIGEALGEMNGVAKVRKGAVGNDVSLNGFHSRNLTVLIDGERIYGACPNSMDPAVFHADFAEVDRLEIAKGPFDIRHQGSLGGLVNVVTRAPGPGFHGSPSVSAGSWGYINPSAVASWGNDGVSALGGYSYRTSDPYRDGSGTLFTQYANYRPNAMSSTAFEVQTGWARLYFSPHPKHSAQVAYTRQQADHVLYPYLQMDGMTDRADRLNVSYDIARDGGRIKAISARAYYSGVDHWMTDSLRVSSTGVPREYSMGTQANTGTAGGHVEVVTGDVTSGVEAFRGNWDATTSMAGSKYVPQYSIPFATTDHVGIFTEYEGRLGNQTKLAAGGRFDYAHSGVDAAKANTDLYFAYNGTRSVSAIDTGASGKIRVTRQVGSNLEVLAGLGHTFRVPDAVERYFALKRMGSDWVGNPALKPTQNTGVQVGANYHYRRALASVSVHQDWVANFITVHGQGRTNVVPGIMNTTARSYANVDARMLTGEFTVTYPVTDRLVAAVSGAYTRATKATNPAVGINSPYVSEIPPASGSVSLRYDRAVVFAEARGVFAASQDRVDTDLQEATTPGYGALDLSVGVRVKQLRMTIALDNVFNRLYLNYNSYQRDPYRTGARVPEPGRNVYPRLSYRF